MSVKDFVQTFFIIIYIAKPLMGSHVFREHMQDINLVDWKTVIVDECHRVKEPKSAITCALKSLSKLILNGLIFQPKEIINSYFLNCAL